MKRQIILDLETTSLEPADGHRIIEIAAIELIDGKETGLIFHTYLNPDRELDEEIREILGFDNPNSLSDSPHFSDIAPTLVKFISDAELIIHHAPFDVSFLNNELKLDGARFGPIESLCSITDTLMLAKRLYPDQRNSLGALCNRLGIDCDKTFSALYAAKQLVRAHERMNSSTTITIKEI